MNLIENRDGQSFAFLDNTMYLFGGQGPGEDKYSNELFTIKFEIEPKPKAIISEVIIENK